MATPVLAIEEIKEIIRDRAESNHIIDGSEFSDIVLNLAIDFAIQKFNMIPPLGASDLYNFPNKTLLLYGALGEAFLGQSALYARNSFNYNDGGVSVSTEEKFALYQTLGTMYQNMFMDAARSIKIYSNIESGWGELSSDYANFPIW